MNTYDHDAGDLLLVVQRLQLKVARLEESRSIKWKLKNIRFRLACAYRRAARKHYDWINGKLGGVP